METTAIIIGATGLVGKSLVEQLSAANHVSRIITLTRRPVTTGSGKIRNHVIDFEKMEEHTALFTGDLLFSCLGTTHRQAGSIETQRRVDLDYQYQAARLAADQGVRHYLLVSSSGADSGSRNAYLKMKGELEERVVTLPFERISIFQPSLLLGKRPDIRLGEFLGSLILPALTRIPGLQQYRPIPGEQVAKKMVQVSQDPGPNREWFRLDEIFQPTPHALV